MQHQGNTGTSQHATCADATYQYCSEQENNEWVHACTEPSHASHGSSRGTLPNCRSPYSSIDSTARHGRDVAVKRTYMTESQSLQCSKGLLLCGVPTQSESDKQLLLGCCCCCKVLLTIQGMAEV
jgi:hypothetical protein